MWHYCRSAAAWSASRRRPWHTKNALTVDRSNPFESIDPAGVAMMKQWLRRFIDAGKTIFLTSHVLETIERLCDRVAIIKSPGHLVWEGDITPLALDQPVLCDGEQFRTLETLFLHVAGEQYTALDWI